MSIPTKIFSIILLSILLASCSLMPNEMKTAEKIMESNPDSALHILQHMQPYNSLTEADRAMYGLLLFQALDKNNQPLQPDSVIIFSMDYFQRVNDKPHLAYCYFYKGRIYKIGQRYDEATDLYFKALDNNISEKNPYLLGKIYSDMGDICSFQKDFSEALNKYNLSAEYFKKAGKTIDASYSILNIGRTYRLTKNYNKASVYYRKVFNKMSDSIFNGLLIQEMGINYYSAKQYDSAQYYLRKSICFPYKSTNFSIRCFILADLYFDIERYDSASFYALKSLKYPANFLTQRECYRLLANAEFVNGNFRQMAKYMTYFQACSDSVRKIESQTKVTVLEELHLTTASASKRKQYVYILSWLIPLIILVSLLIFYRLKIRNKGKEKELKEAEVQIIYKQNLLFDALIQKINEYKNSQSAIYKKSTLQQKEILDKELYNQCLHVNDWNLFKKLMDKTLNNIVSFLEKNYPEITHKEITFCCLILLDIPTPDIALILESQPGTLYKMKSRLTQKMKLKSNKDLDALLKRKSEGK